MDPTRQTSLSEHQKTPMLNQGIPDCVRVECCAMLPFVDYSH
jgi:hypothetical protein